MGAGSGVPRSLEGLSDRDIQDHVASLIASDPERATRILASIKINKPTSESTSVSPSKPKAFKVAAANSPSKPMTDFCSARDILDEHNKLRQDPAGYADLLVPLLGKFDGMKFIKVPNEVQILTNEGAAAVQECIDFLMKQSPLPPYSPEMPEGLTQAAVDHALDTGSAGIVGHVGSDDSSPSSRMLKYGQWLEASAENISYGHSTAAEIIQQLIIDDGIPNRGHRANIFDAKMKVIGVGMAPHKIYGSCCVIDYAGGYGIKAPTEKQELQGSEMTPAFEALFAAMPQFEQMVATARAELETGKNVRIVYDPNGSVEVTTDQGTMMGKWSRRGS
jgi:uncharacterized protein YkwD